jgi:spoIIIJ-associated protein
MLKEAIGSGSTVEEARQNAFEMLGVAEDAAVEYEVLDYQQEKIFGLFGGKPARVRAYIEESKPEKCAAYIRAIIEKMGIDNANIEIQEFDGGAQFNITGDNIGSVIGRRGETLDAIQYLTSLAMNHKDDKYFRVVINIGNYREKRETALKGLAGKIAKNVLRSGRKTTLEPMSPFERRIIHTTIQEIDGVTSWSVGEEPNRAVVIGRDKNSKDDFKGKKGGYDKKQNKPEAPKSTREPKVLDDQDIPLYGRIDI